MKRFLEAGKIVNTHGVKGEVKIQPWANEPGFLCSFKRLLVDGEAMNVRSARVHKDCVIVSLEGVSDIDGAIALKGKPVSIFREDAKLLEGENFVQDIVGLDAVSADTGVKLGVVSEVLDLPAGDVYVIKGEREILVPAVPEFIVEKDVEGGKITVRLIEGM